MAIKARSRATNKKTAAARAKAHDRRLMARAERETAEGTAVPVDRDELKRLYSLLARAQHEAIKGGAPRAYMWEGWGFESTLKAYETLEIARRAISDLVPEVQP